MIRQVYNWARDKFNGDSSKESLSKLLDRRSIKMFKTQEVKATDRPGEPISFSYRFIFDSEARRQSFLNAVTNMAPQYWDIWVRWMKDISHLASNPWRGDKEGTGEVEICVEAQCLIPTEELGKFQYSFAQFITTQLKI